MTPIKTAISSFGLSGRVFHAPFLHLNPGFELYGVLERTTQKAKSIYPDIRSFSTWDELLADPAIELVIVNTPNHTHFEFAKKALEAGKHVIVEKPFTCTSEEAKTLIRLSQEKKLFLTVYHNRRFDSDFKTVKKVLDKDYVGELISASFRFDRYKPELSVKEHKEADVPGNGILYDLGPHIIDQALYLFGLPEAVFAHLEKQREGTLVYDAFQMTLFYKSFSVQLHAGFFNREMVPSYVLQGRKGSFLKHRGDVQETLLEKGALPQKDGWAIESAQFAGHLHTEYNGNIISEKLPTEIGNYMEYFDKVAYSICNQTPFMITAEDGLNSIRIIEAALKSHAEKRVIHLL